jgi:hypothetical protein
VVSTVGEASLKPPVRPFRGEPGGGRLRAEIVDGVCRGTMSMADFVRRVAAAVGGALCAGCGFVRRVSAASAAVEAAAVDR